MRMERRTVVVAAAVPSSAAFCAARTAEVSRELCVRCVDGVITAEGAWPSRSLRAAAKVSSALSVGTSCSHSGAATAGGASVAPAATAPPSSCRLGTAALRIALARKRGANATSRRSMVLRLLSML